MHILKDLRYHILAAVMVHHASVELASALAQMFNFFNELDFLYNTNEIFKKNS